MLSAWIYHRGPSRGSARNDLWGLGITIAATYGGSSMETEVRAILREHSGIGESAHHIGVHENLWLLGMTSLASVQVMLALESAFAVEIPDEKLLHATFSSIHQIQACITELTTRTAR
jgi:acyl carrier protein